MESVEISKAEKNLVDQLKLVCDENGKEFDPNKSVPIFHDMAKIYGSKTKQKKFNAIRSVALYNAAIVRDPNNEKIKSDLKSFCSTVLDKAKANNLLNGNLVRISENLYQIVKGAREKIEEQYNKVTQIPDNVQADELVKLQRKKISDVQKSQHVVTKQYTELMKFVSDECIQIMGKPPCKYAVVGLGSLARSEITLYSDFEHIILLEDEAAWTEERKTIMKYFRWFSTIFHIVLINLGETMIPSVAIPSLNGETTNWFYDAFTPNGVTFDGLMSHASKIPLGRQPTVNKQWKMELIKPVKEMLRLLEKEEDIKQEYHLADILSKSCFVAGEEALFWEYQDKSHEVVKRKDEDSNFSMVRDQLEEDLKNLNIINKQLIYSQGLQSFNIKRVIYRSATIFIASIGRRYSIKGSSCFDIIDILEQRNLCSEIVAHELRFMVAVACEIRFKVYYSKGQQDDIFMEGSDPKSIMPGLTFFVGQQTFLSFMETVVSVHCLILHAIVEEFSLDFSQMDTDAWNYSSKVTALCFLGLKEDVKMEISKLIDNPSIFEKVGISSSLIAIQVLLKISEHSLCLDLCEKIYSLCINNSDKLQVRVTALQCKIKLGQCDERHNQTEIEDLDNLVVFCENGNDVDAVILCMTLLDYSKCLLLVKQNEQAYKIMEKSFKSFKKFQKSPQKKFYPKLFDVCYLTTYSNNLVKIEHFQEAFQKVQDCLVVLKLKGYQRTTGLHDEIYQILGCCYYKFGQYLECFISWCEVVRILNATNQPVHQKIKQQVQMCFREYTKRCKTVVDLLWVLLQKY